jgi:hypothetical protein
MKWKTQVHSNFKGFKTSWMCKGLVAIHKLKALSSKLASNDSQNTTPIHNWL